MSRRRSIALLILLAALPAPGFGQFDLDWYTIDGGGAMFTAGGIFELSGTIGQPDAGSFTQPLSGGVFELVGGFWPVARPPCVGDVSGDGVVDISDLAALLAAFGSCAGGAAFNAAADFDGSGCIELADLTQLLANFGTTCP